MDHLLPSSRRKPQDRRMADRRGSGRFPAEMTIRSLRSANRMQCVPGTLLEASMSGVRLWLSEHIPEGERLLIEIRPEGESTLNLTVVVVWNDILDDSTSIAGCELCVEMPLRQYNLLKTLAAESVAVKTRGDS